MTGQSPTAHPRKRLGFGVIDNPPNYSSKDKGEREGYTPVAFSLQSSRFHPKAFAFHPTMLLMPPARTMAEPMRSSVDGEAPEAFHAGNPPPTSGPLVDVVSHPPIPPLEVDHHHTLFMLFIFI
jgi:hypothetical protein